MLYCIKNEDKMMSKQKDEIKRLKILDESYTNGIPLVSDTSYDILKSNIKAEYPNDPYFDTVGFISASAEKVQLPYILGSLNKTKLDGSCTKWLNKYGKHGVVISEKMDGCSIYVEYQDNKVVFASTRGNGYQGQNITNKAKIFCPGTIYNGSLKVRGEVYMTFQDAIECGYKNPRNAVAGILNREDGKHVEFLKVKFYHVYDNDGTFTADNFFLIQEAKLPCVDFIIKTEPITDEYLSGYYKDIKSELEYPIDGLVVSTITKHIENEYYPEFTMAFKVNEDAIETTEHGTEWNVTRTGKIVPVVLIDPIDINGSTISRVTGFNAKYINNNGIGKGAVLGIVKSGDIIPYIEYIEEIGKVDIPTHCPCCGTHLRWTDTGVDLICDGVNCPDKIVYQIEHFLDCHGVEEMSAATIRSIGIDSIEELYNLDEFSLMGQEGFGTKRINTVLTQIKKTLNTTPSNLLRSFGINGIGKTVSNDITNKWGFDELFLVSKDQFQEIDGIGDVLSGNLINGLEDNYGLYKYLLDNGLKFKKTDTTMKGTVFTLTGKSEYKRNDLIKMVEGVGGTVKGISKKSNYVVTNDINSKSGKMKKAHQYGISIITYDDFYEMLNI